MAGISPESPIPLCNIYVCSNYQNQDPQRKVCAVISTQQSVQKHYPDQKVTLESLPRNISCPFFTSNIQPTNNSSESAPQNPERSDMDYTPVLVKLKINPDETPPDTAKTS